MEVKFDGRAFAKLKEKKLTKEVWELKNKGITPKLVSIVVGDEGGAKFYQSLKQKAAERIGLKLEIRRFPQNVNLTELTEVIQRLNDDSSVHGLMIQLPLPDNLRGDTEVLINEIDPKKDVDGLRQDSFFVAPVLKAILKAIKEGSEYLVGEPKVVVVGAKGSVGKKAVQALKEMGYLVDEVDIESIDLEVKTKDADLLILASGKAGLIKSDTIKKGSVVIDVGAPKGDLDPKAYSNCSFITPVPGGIGPVTIACLMENLIIAASNTI